MKYLKKKIKSVESLRKILFKMAMQLLSRLEPLVQQLGQSSSQLTQWISVESGLLLALAACWGTVLGLLMSQVLIHRVNPQSFHWTMETSLPAVAIVVLMLVTVLLGVLAAVWAAKRNLNPERLALSLREDW